MSMMDSNPVHCDVNLFHNIPSPQVIKDEMLTKTGAITDDIALLKTKSDTLTEEAKTLIAQASVFTPVISTDFSFEADVGNFSFENSNYQPLTGVYRPPIGGGLQLGAPPSLKVAPFQLSTLSKPQLLGVVFDQALAPFAPINPPNAPLSQPVNIGPAPAFNPSIDLGGIPDEGSAPAPPSVSADPIPLLDLAPYTGGNILMPSTVDFDRLENALAQDFQIPEYHQKMLPVLMPAVGALMAHDGFAVPIEDLFETSDQLLEKALIEYGRRLGPLWSRRGMFNSQDRLLTLRNVAVRDRYYEYTQHEYEAATARWRMKLLPVALELATEAHGITMEILGELYDLEFEYLAAKQVAMLSLYGLAVARFNLQIAQMQVVAAQYRGQLAYVQGRASHYGIFVKQQQYTASLNTALGSAYDATHRPIIMRADLYRTEASLVEADLDAYKAWAQSVEAQAQALRAKFVDYEARVAAWGAEAEMVANRHRVNRLKNRERMAQNKAVAASLSADATAAGAVSYAAVQSAAETRAAVAQARAVLATRMAENDQTGYVNAEEIAKYVLATDDYRIEAAQYGTDTLPDRTVFGAQGEINSRAASLYNELAQSTVKAAELSQQYRNKLSDAYQAVYEAVGRADAARVSGELSKYRASLGLQTQGQISHSSQLSRQTRSSSDYKKGASNECISDWAYNEKARTE